MDRIDELLCVVPQSPDFDICWEEIEEHSFMCPFAAGMKETLQNPKYHAEGNVWNHTKMVCECLVKDKDFRTLEEKQRQELFIAALFHDAGKRHTTRLENGEWVSPGHAIVGAQITRDLLWREYGICGSEELQNFRETICLLIRYHMSVPYIFESDNPEIRLIKTAANGELAPDFNLKLLFLLAKADANGKIADNNRKGEETVLLVEEAAKENGCLTEPIRFSDPYTEYAFLSGKNVAPNTELYNDTNCEVILICGLPGTGKDTWIRVEYPDYPVISLDDIREEFGISPSGDQSEVIRIAKSRAKQLLRNKQSFVWNATSVTPDIRSRLISLFNNYHAYVKIVFLETEWNENLRRNMERPNSVPEYVIESMLTKLTLPERFEAHEVGWNCI